MSYRTTHANPLWRYEDARGVEHRGHAAGFSDRGGTDVTYYFRDCATHELTLVSGARLKAAERLWNCPCGKTGVIA
jgi:hypothetical protein